MVRAAAPWPCHAQLPALLRDTLPAVDATRQLLYEYFLLHHAPDLTIIEALDPCPP